MAHPDAIAQRHIVPGVNFNELVYESVEVCGAGPQPFTAAQFEAVAQLAAAHRATGLPVAAPTSWPTPTSILSRVSDPWPASTRERYMSRVIARANSILRPPTVTVTVKAGDTLSGIAKAHALTRGGPARLSGEREVPRQPRAHPPGRHRPREMTGGAMDSEPGTIWGREPAMVLALVQAVIALVVRSASTSHPTRSVRSSPSRRWSWGASRAAG